MTIFQVNTYCTEGEGAGKVRLCDCESEITIRVVVIIYYQLGVDPGAIG